MLFIGHFSGNYNGFSGYNEDLANQIIAASDFLLMPLRLEPCGLIQMYAMRNGTVPIVRRTAGLRNTVIDFGDNGNGIYREQESMVAVYYSIQGAVNLHYDRKNLNKIRRKGMNMVYAWERLIQEYIEMYHLTTIKYEI